MHPFFPSAVSACPASCQHQWLTVSVFGYWTSLNCYRLLWNSYLDNTIYRSSIARSTARLEHFLCRTDGLMTAHSIFAYHS